MTTGILAAGSRRGEDAAGPGNGRTGNSRPDNSRADNSRAENVRADGARTANARIDGARVDGARVDGARIDGARTGNAAPGNAGPGNAGPGGANPAGGNGLAGRNGRGTPAYPTGAHPAAGNLDETVTARWRRRVAGVRAEEKRHWRTKTAYYAAVNRLVTDGAPRLGWAQIAQAVEPRGSRSTFYEVTGAHAKHPLIGDLLADDGIDTMQLAMCYRRDKAVDQLIDETKVWTYWPYRECLSIRYRIDPNLDAHASAEMLVFTVAEWARRNPRLAAMLGCAPPVCAVEDLLVVRPGQLSALCAVNTLTRVVRDAISGGGGYPVAGYRNW